MDHREHDQRNGTRGPDALAARILADLTEAGYHVLPENGLEDTARGDQPFDPMAPEMRPQDTWGDGRDWKFETLEHGGDEPDHMPQAIQATDAEGRWAIYVPLTVGGKIVVPRPVPDDHAAEDQSAGQTDWARLRSMTDDEIDAGISDDPDVEPTDEAFWQGARLVWPKR